MLWPFAVLIAIVPYQSQGDTRSQEINETTPFVCLRPIIHLHPVILQSPEEGETSIPSSVFVVVSNPEAKCPTLNMITS